MESAFRPYARMFDFEGCAARAEFWGYTLLVGLVSIILLFAGAVITTHDPTFPSVDALVGIWLVLNFLPALSVNVRRLHDTGRSGWFVLLNFIPIVNLIGFVFTLLPTKRSGNRFRKAEPTPRATIFDSPAPAPEPSANLAASPDAIADLERLASLRERGMLTDEEYADQKRLLLSRS